MKTYLPLLVSIAYFLVAIDCVTESKWAWALTWFCYAGANIGLVLAAGE